MLGHICYKKCNYKPSLDYLVKQVAFKQQDYTQKPGVRPFGLCCLIGGFNKDNKEAEEKRRRTVVILVSHGASIDSWGRYWKDKNYKG